MMQEAQAHRNTLDAMLGHLLALMQALGVDDDATCHTLRKARATWEAALLPVYGMGMDAWREVH
jgi:hypothetical protein